MSSWTSCRLILLFAVLVLLGLVGPGQTQAELGKKYALLVGVRTYRHSKLEDLKYTENDVEDLAALLEREFAEVVLLTSTRGQAKAERAPTAANIRKHLRALLEKVGKHDTIVVALAGHGLQLKVKGQDAEEGFFCPADAKPREGATLAEQSKTLIGFAELFRQLDESGVGVKLLLVDACRNDPAAGRSVTADTIPRPPRGLAALFSCKSGERAFETDKLGRGHGVFFHHVIEGLKGEAKNRRGEVTWGGLAEHVTEKVSDEVPKLIGGGARQTPEEIKKLVGKSPVLLGPARERVVKEEPKEITSSIGMKLARIPAGTFLMGSPRDEAKREPCEGPQHEVEITRAFYLGAHEVTQKQYQAVMGKDPSCFRAGGSYKERVALTSTDDFPVDQVEWEDAVEFCKKLSALPAEAKEGRKYRLPTEAEWEYASRAGAPSYQVFHYGNSLSGTQANFEGSKPYGDAGKAAPLNRTCKVGSYTANRFGLFDMHGNVSEWCADWFGEDYYASSSRKDPTGPEKGKFRVLRGGAWCLDAASCRSGCRNGGDPVFAGSCGFRVACDVAPR
jgi:formylglycine-generating enzyme required for sulfatase activity